MTRLHRKPAAGLPSERVDVDAGFLALLCGDRGGRAGERVAAARGLGERHNLADRVRTDDLGNESVDPEGDPAVRRRTVLEGFEQEAELALCLLAGQTNDVED